jgi:hypothetical protein
MTTEVPREAGGWEVKSWTASRRHGIAEQENGACIGWAGMTLNSMGAVLAQGESQSASGSLNLLTMFLVSHCHGGLACFGAPTWTSWMTTGIVACAKGCKGSALAGEDGVRLRLTSVSRLVTDRVEPVTGSGCTGSSGACASASCDAFRLSMAWWNSGHHS